MAQPKLKSPPGPPRTSRRRIALLVAVLVALQLTTRLLPPGEVPVSVCLVRNMSGFPCPSCGMSRGFHAMATWRPAEALAFNIFSPLVYSASWLLLIIGLVDLTLKPGLLDRLWLRVKWPVVVVVVVAMAASWVINLNTHFRTHTVLESLAGSWPGRLVSLVLEGARAAFGG